MFTLSLALTGCGSDSAEPSSSPRGEPETVDACTLLTAAEIEAVTGITPGEKEKPNPGINSCQWANPGAELPIVYISSTYSGSDTREEYRAYLIENGYDNPDADGEWIDVGRFAYFQPDVHMIQVHADRGSLITLQVRGGSKAQIIELADKATARLR